MALKTLWMYFTRLHKSSASADNLLHRMWLDLPIRIRDLDSFAEHIQIKLSKFSWHIDPAECKVFKCVRDDYLRLIRILKLCLQIWRRFSIRAYLESHDSISMISAEDLVARRKQYSKYRTFLCDWYTIRKCWNHDKCPHIHYITGKPISCLISRSWSWLYRILVPFICKDPDGLVCPNLEFILICNHV